MASGSHKAISHLVYILEIISYLAGFEHRFQKIVTYYNFITKRMPGMVHPGQNCGLRKQHTVVGKLAVADLLKALQQVADLKILLFLALHIVDVIDAIKSDNKHVYAMVAPAAEGQFGANITMNSWKKAMQAVGFNGFVEVALGGDMTAAYEADEWLEAYEAGEKKVTSCCPGFVNMVRKHYPELADKISTTVSPMCAVSRMIKAKDPDAVTVFIGPCVAKKSEVHDQKIEGNADYVLTFSEIRAIMKAKGVQLEADDTSYQEGSVFGKRFANSGGVTAAVIESMKEKGEDVDCKVCKANGAAECKKALLLMKAGKLPENFIEGMACEGGCVGGPSSYNDMVTTKKFRDDLLSRADDRKIRDNIANYHMETFEMHRKEQ